MLSIADLIEKYIIALINQSKDGITELQRNELSLKFECVPSQINYVLGTRFTIDRGYIVESRRGGGGYLRIIKVPIERKEDLLSLINQSANKYVSQRSANNLIDRLVIEEYLTKREGMLVKSLVQDNSIAIESPKKDLVRANLMKCMLVTIIREDFI